MEHRTTRTLSALLVVGALLAACGGGDDGADDAARVEAIVPDTCALIPLGEVSRVTGLAFDRSAAGTNTCTYTSSEAFAAVTLDLTAVAKAPEASLADSRSKCDQTTVVDLQPSALIIGGFGCLFNGLPHIVVVTPEPGARKYILNAGNPNPGTLTGPLLQSMASLLQIAVEHG